jgi:hypothetical protein
VFASLGSGYHIGIFCTGRRASAAVVYGVHHGTAVHERFPRFRCGSGGIQYVVSDAKAVEALAKARQVTIAQPLSTLASFSLKTICLDDPDGITNYFAETAASGRQRPKRNDHAETGGRRDQ